MVSVNMLQVICSFYNIQPSFKPTFSSRLNTNLADAMHDVSKSVTLNNYSPSFQKFFRDSFDSRLLVLKASQSSWSSEILDKFLIFKTHSTLSLKTVLSNTHKILDISLSEKPSSIKFSIKILRITNLLVPTVFCGVHEPKVEHSILRDMIALRSVYPSLRKSSIDR